jgi:hypothetical protein
MICRVDRVARRIGLIVTTFTAAHLAGLPSCRRIVLAQVEPARLETIDLGLGLYTDANHALFHDFWDPGAGVEAFVAFPFHAGRLRLGLQQFHNDPVAGAVGFRSRYFHLGIDGSVRVAGRVRLRAGPEVGIYHMWFDDASIPDFSRSESEFALGAGTGLDLFPAARWGISLLGRYQLVLTERRIHRVMLGAALTYRAGFPAWLRGFLD